MNPLIGLCQLPAQPASPAPVSPDAEAPTVVTVTGRAMPIETVSASVTVLSREWIEGSHAVSAADLLRDVPFLYLSQSGAGGGLASVTVRGSKPNFVLAMIDGIPVNDTTNLLGGSFDYSQLTLDNVEQVEIVRGPLSSVYGSDAIGAVINFVSRRGNKTQPLEVAVEGGSFASRHFRLSSGSVWKALQYSFSASYLDVGEQVYRDPYSLGTAALHSSVSLGPGRILALTAHYDEKESAGLPSNGGGPEFAILRDPLHDHAVEFVIGASYRAQLRKWWSYSLQADRFTSHDHNSTPAILDAIPPGRGTQPSSRNVSEFHRTRVGAATDFQITSALSLRLAAGLRAEDGSTIGVLNGNIPDSYHLSRQSFDSSFEISYTTGRFSASAGIALEKPEGLGVIASPRVGATYAVSKSGPRLRASWAEGFKLPSFYALANPLVGNPTLKPEHSRAFDIGAAQQFKGATAAITYFENRFTDLIDFSAQIFKLVNRSRSHTQGIEFQTDAPAGWRLRPGLAFSYVGWRLEDTPEPLRDVPHWTGGAHLVWTIPHGLSGRIATEWIGRRYDFSVPEPQVPAVGGYSDTNAAIHYRVNARLAFYARVDNLLNSKFHDYIGFPNPGITGRVGLNYSPLAR
jgi:vitamin B12 transporter